MPLFQTLLGYYLIALDRYRAWLRVKKWRPFVVLFGIFAQAILVVELIWMLAEPAQSVLMTAYVIIVLALFPFFMGIGKEMKFPGDSS